MCVVVGVIFHHHVDADDVGLGDDIDDHKGRHHRLKPHPTTTNSVLSLCLLFLLQLLLLLPLLRLRLRLQLPGSKAADP